MADERVGAIAGGAAVVEDAGGAVGEAAHEWPRGKVFNEIPRERKAMKEGGLSCQGRISFGGLVACLLAYLGFSIFFFFFLLFSMGTGGNNLVYF